MESGLYLSPDLRLDKSCNNTVILTRDYRAITRVINHGKLCGVQTNNQCWTQDFDQTDSRPISSDPSDHSTTNKQVSGIVVYQVYQVYPVSIEDSRTLNRGYSF